MKRIYMVMPTWNNDAMCAQAIRSLYEYTEFDKYGRLLVIDNSDQPSPELIASQIRYGFTVHRALENLGWMSSINAGFRWDKDQHEFLTMCNDDVVFPQDRRFWPRHLELFDGDTAVGGIGPVSNYVMGAQNVKAQVDGEIGEVPLLIGFCATYRADALMPVGLLDTRLPGGDDLDLSIRMRQAGWKLLCDRRNFLYHYGSVTGNRVHSDWDNLQSQHRTLNAIIRKHGLRVWYECVTPTWTPYDGPPLPPGLANHVMAEVEALGSYVWSKGVSVVEGSCTPKELQFLAKRVQGAKQVCEVGFNMGMSACAMLAANPNLIVVSYDLGEWACVKIAHEYLDDRFEGRHLLIEGDSTVTFKPPLTPWEFCFIDGGHSFDVAYRDIANFAPHSRYVMVDDIKMEGVAKALEIAINERLLTEVEWYTDRENPSSPRFWAVGKGGAK